MCFESEDAKISRSQNKQVINVSNANTHDNPGDTKN